ncbi:MAG: hypothetical protein RLZ72_331 [Actinomycetota bacterium]
MSQMHSLDATTITLPDPQPKPTSLDGQLESSLELWVSADGELESGVWECSPGTFTASRDGYDEVCTIVSGRATVTDSDGVVTELSAGSALVTPAGWRGTWVVHETVRKTYVIRNLAV